jgi:hypothetical protein
MNTDYDPPKVTTSVCKSLSNPYFSGFAQTLFVKRVNPSFAVFVISAGISLIEA